VCGGSTRPASGPPNCPTWSHDQVRHKSNRFVYGWNCHKSNGLIYGCKPIIQHVFCDAGTTLVYPNFPLVGEKLAARGARVAVEELERGEQQARFLLDDPQVI